LLITLHERLASEKLVVAFVAEFSRGKSELINAIFFADAGRRVLPARPGRTTMCPVEMRFEIGAAPCLSLLPIETRLQGLSLSELRGRQANWHHQPLDPDQPDALAAAMAAVTQTRVVTVQEAAALGFWHESQPDDNPPRLPDGQVEVPAWRHAIVNYPHPLLQRGLVVIDTPGLNAVGAEPELTLSLLPSAHAVVFVLAADTGVTRSDWAMWRDHLGHEGLERFVVLNKIDALADPLLSVADVQAQIEQQRLSVARTLGVSDERVFPVSARQALTGRIEHNAELMQTSRLLPLEQALAAQLMPRRQAMLLQATETVFEHLHQSALRRVADRRRQLAEQLLELRGLRGKSGMKLRVLMARVDSEASDFERCTARLAALRMVHERLHLAMLAPLSLNTLREEGSSMQSAMAARLFNLGARSAFDALLLRLRQALARVAVQAEELRLMLDGSYTQLNAEFGFAFVLVPPPKLTKPMQEIDLIAAGYGKYLGLSQAWRKAAPGFADHFRRMLMSKLRVIYENTSADFELWSKSAQAQVDVQLRERRRGFARRRDGLQRVQAAAGELEERIAQVQQQDSHLAALYVCVDTVASRAVALARSGPQGMVSLAESASPSAAWAAAPAPSPMAGDAARGGNRHQAVAA
jgi:Dynamin family